MLKQITDIIKSADSAALTLEEHKENPDKEVSYIIHYDDKYMMNKKADDLRRSQSFIYIEEFVQGSYNKGKYNNGTKSIRTQIYFCKFIEMHNEAINRQKLRSIIETEIVVPFIKAYENKYGEVQQWKFYYPLPRWDGNEVSVLLEFDCIIPIC